VTTLSNGPARRGANAVERLVERVSAASLCDLCFLGTRGTRSCRQSAFNPLVQGSSPWRPTSPELRLHVPAVIMPRAREARVGAW
jgi:hypothetical protein